MSITASLKAFFSSIMYQLLPSSGQAPSSPSSSDDLEAQPFPADELRSSDPPPPSPSNQQAAAALPSSGQPPSSLSVDDLEAQPAAADALPSSDSPPSSPPNQPAPDALPSSDHPPSSPSNQPAPADALPSSDPPPSSPSTDDLEAPPAASALAEHQNPNQFLLQWQIVMTFCFTSAIEIATQTKSPLSVSFNVLSFIILIIFLLLFVANSIGKKFTVLVKVIIILVGASFIITITIPFELWFKYTAWALYAISLLVIEVCNKF